MLLEWYEDNLDVLIKDDEALDAYIEEKRIEFRKIFFEFLEECQEDLFDV